MSRISATYKAKDFEKPYFNLSVSKQFGTFFTQETESKCLVELLPGKPKNKILVDPCCGGGALLGQALLGKNPNRYEKIVGIELDNSSAKWCSLLLRRIGDLVGFKGDVQIVGGDLTLLTEGVISGKGSFDIIINPPFGRLKFNSDRLTNNETKLSNNATNTTAATFKQKIEVYKDELFKNFPEINKSSGVPEFSKLFFLACYENWKCGASVSCIGPDDGSR